VETMRLEKKDTVILRRPEGRIPSLARRNVKVFPSFQGMQPSDTVRGRGLAYLPHGVAARIATTCTWTPARGVGFTSQVV
jgi:hypothetical protein